MKKLVVFTAPWCQSCKQYYPVLTQLTDYYGIKIEYYNIEDDEDKELAIDMGVKSLPTTFIMDGYEIYQKIIGNNSVEYLVSCLTNNEN